MVIDFINHYIISRDREAYILPHDHIIARAAYISPHDQIIVRLIYRRTIKLSCGLYN